MLKITFLGTGTSQGIPVIGCQCPVCQSEDSRDKRLRCSVLVEWNGKSYVIDVGPDFRQQALRANISKIDALLLTHEHNDHIIGLDDVRPLNFLYKKHMSVYGLERVLNDVQKRFPYVFEINPYPGAPRVTLHTIDHTENFSVQDSLPITPILLMHGRLPILGFRFDNFTYLTDMKTISEEAFQKVVGTDVLVVNALHHRTHHSHLNLKEALLFIEQVQPKRAYLLHMSHLMGKHEEVSKTLPDNVFLAYDGLELLI